MKRKDEVTIYFRADKVEVVHKGCVGSATNRGDEMEALGRAVANWDAEWNTMKPEKGV